MSDNQKNKFITFVKKSVSTTGCTYSDAIVSFHEKEKVEIETLSSWIRRDPDLKEKLRAEALILKMVKE